MTSQHYDPGIVSPRPHRTDNPAADLDSMGEQQHQQHKQEPPTYSSYAMPAPSFGPSVHVPMSAPAAGPASDWSPWAFTAAPRSPFPHPPPAPPTPAMAPAASTHRPSSTTNTTSLTATLPSVPTLLEAMPSITSPSLDANLKVTWARDVFFLVDRAHHLHLAVTTPVGQPVPSVSDPITGPLPASALDPDIVRLAGTAVPLVLDIAAAYPHGLPYNQGASGSGGSSQGMQAYEAEAVYMRAVLAGTGAFPQHVVFNPKAAFRDFETAARGGYAGAWYRLARDYEAFGDLKHARDCFERGAKLGVESCLYRLGMAQLLGQLGMEGDVGKALPILQRAAVLASLECPQPAYVYSLLLLSEFSSIPPIAPAVFASLSSIPSYPPPPTHASTALTPLIPLGSSPHLESRHHLERAAYLHYAPAQYKLGHAYEFADPPFYFDPLLSVQYYSLASQGGEVEADMALSKWFLCGSAGSSVGSKREAERGGGFEKDEGLALTFAQKASGRNLSSAHFAMGYYAEVGVGRGVSVPDAVHYYTLAANAGNQDARGRLDVLGRESAESNRLSKGVHEQRVERTRTMAQRRTEETPMSPPYQGQTFPSLAEAQKVAMSAGANGQQSFGNLPVPGSTNALAPPTSALAALSLSPQRAAAAQRDPRAVVELVRKNTMSTYLPLGSAAGAIQGGQAPPLPRPPQSATQPSYTPSTGGPPSYASNPTSSAYPTTPTNTTGPSRLDALRNPQPGSARPPSGGANQQQHPGFGPRPPSAGPRPPSVGKNRPQSQFPGTAGGGGQGGYASPRPQSAYPMPPHSANPAYNTHGHAPSSRPDSQASTASYAGSQGQGGYGGGQGQGGYGGSGGHQGGQGQGGRRPQSPGRKASPGPGRMGKLRVGVEEYGVPPVPGTGAPPNTATAPSTANPANANTPGLAVPNTSLAGQTPRPTGKHPATFAEMGIQGAKAEDKDCKVM
ncbi:HCP-like protein [Coprinellus micaceus]|uniref:HCP-like protein n=1 Tax=Coprinellus micaceus TaxID=71717 RepID=A0A4Y7SAJ7_COPMI|nr:HCP-like protein [Coprinellus micaceus]